MKAGKSAIRSWLSCQYNKNTVVDLPSSVVDAPKYYVTSVSKKLGQGAVVYYFALSQFFLKQTLYLLRNEFEILTNRATKYIFVTQGNFDSKNKN